MRDEFDARLWNDNHAEFAAGLDRAASQLAHSFRRSTMTGLRSRLTAALGAIAISSVFVLGTIGPIDAGAAPALVDASTAPAALRA